MSLERRLFRAAARLYALYAASWRVRIIHADGIAVAPAAHPFGREIYALRERDLVAATVMARHSPFVALVAEGKDGDRATAAVEAFGFRIVRGSTRHHPLAAARELISALLESSLPGVLVVDGPVGPAGVAQEGIALLAARTGRSITPAAADARPRGTLSWLWSGIIVPFPFARVTIALSETIDVPRASDRAGLRAVAARVTAALAAAGQLAEELT